MKVVAKTSTYPLHLEVPPRFIMFAVLRMCLLTQIQLLHAALVPEHHNHRPVCRHLTYSSSQDDDDTPPGKIPSPNNTVQYQINTPHQPSPKYTLNVYVTLEAEEEEEEDFQTVPLNDEHWDMEEIPDRHLCFHKHSLPQGLCPYPCPYSDYQTSSYYDTLYLNNISEFKDLMPTPSIEDIPALNDIGY